MCIIRSETFIEIDSLTVNIENPPTVEKFHNLFYSTKKTLLVNYFQKWK